VFHRRLGLVDEIGPKVGGVHNRVSRGCHIPRAAGRLVPPLPVPDLAYLLVRIGESFVYTDVITGDAPDAEKAHAAVTALPT